MSYSHIIISILLLTLPSCSENKLSCDTGSVMVGSAPPQGQRQYCGKSAYGKFILDGPYRTWFINGEKHEVGAYSKGKKNGMWYCYSKYGLEVIQEWEDGVKKDGDKCPKANQREFHRKTLREKGKAQDKKKKKKKR